MAFYINDGGGWAETSVFPEGPGWTEVSEEEYQTHEVTMNASLAADLSAAGDREQAEREARRAKGLGVLKRLGLDDDDAESVLEALR